MFRVFLSVTVACVLFCMSNAAYGQGPGFGQQMAAQGQAMGVQGRAFGQGMAAQGRAMGARAGRGAEIEDVQERLLEQRLEMLERQAEQLREAAKRLRERGDR